MEYIKKYKNTLKIFLLLIVLLLAFLYFKNNAEELKKFYKFTFWQLFNLSLLTIIGLLISAYLFKDSLKIFGVNLNLNENLKLTIMSAYTNYFLTKGGQVVKSIYLKKKYNLSYKKYLSLLALTNLIIIFSVSLLSVLALLFKFFRHQYFNFNLIIFWVILNLFSLSLFFLSNHLINPITKKNIFLQKINNTWIRILKQKKIILKLIFICILLNLFLSLKLFVIFNIMSSHVNFLSSIVISSAGLISPLVSITPAALGIREGLMSFSASLLNINFATAIMATATDRITSAFWVILMGIIFSFKHTTNKKN